MKNIVKRLIPATLKRKIKQEIGSTTEYTLRITDKARFSGKRVIVTGGSGAIGSAICFRLAMEGATVGICGRNTEKINVVMNNIRRNGGKAVPIFMDVTDDDSISSGLSEFCAEGKLDILVNNAGGSARGKANSFIEQDFSVIKDIVDLNLIGSMLCTHHALRYMNQKGGRIINMGSVVGIQGKSGMTDYAASKSGIIGFTRSLAVELGKKNITVNCVSPGWVNQIVFDRGQEPLERNVNCMGRSGKTDDVAALVAFLASNEAGYITGQNFIIDGGRSLGLWGDN